MIPLVDDFSTVNSRAVAFHTYRYRMALISTQNPRQTLLQWFTHTPWPGDGWQLLLL
jgi:hypothetical protein